MRLLFALALFFASSDLALSQVESLIDDKGDEHWFGYVPMHGGQDMPHWTPDPDKLELPDAYDSQALGFVTSIKSQGQCGSCWAFAQTKALEGARLGAGLPTIDLGEQDPLVNDRNAAGCRGGPMNASYWVDHGIASERDCPYRANRTSCRKPVADKGASWGFIGSRGRPPTVLELQAGIVTYKVIAVTVSGSNADFRRGGVMTDCRGRGVNHMVNLYGYETLDDGTVQFLGANSWGTRWGPLAGHFKSRQGCNQLASTAESALFVAY